MSAALTETANGNSFRWLVLAVSLVLWSGCSLQPLQQQSIGDLGRIEYRKSQFTNHGVVVGVPHGSLESDAIDYANIISTEIDAGFVVAYGFGAKRIAVTQPLVRRIGYDAVNPPQRGSIYPEFKAALRTVADGDLKIYVGIRLADRNVPVNRIEIATTGFSRAQLSEMAAAFARIRDREIGDSDVPRLDLAIDPLDKISWRVTGVKHHGVLMLAERGLNLRLPAILTRDPAKAAYQKILSRWVAAAVRMIREDLGRLPKTQVSVLEFGKIEAVPGTRGAGVVLGAPHGTFDMYTAKVVRDICSRTRLAGVIATGFTPTESGDGMRINVNRPTEKHVTLNEREFGTERARITYERFRNVVVGAARGNLNLYIDIHQNGGPRIEVATVGITKEEARFIKHRYLEIRNEALAGRPELNIVDLAIEPLDMIEVGAWAAKTHGILSVANKSLHFELPLNSVMASEKHRAVYTHVLTELIDNVAGRIATRP